MNALWTTIAPVNPDVPKTGDDARVALWAALLLMSATYAAAVLFFGRKKNPVK